MEKRNWGNTLLKLHVFALNLPVGGAATTPLIVSAARGVFASLLLEFLEIVIVRPSRH